MATPPRPSAIDERLLATLERAFAHHAGRDAVIDVRELQAALGLRSEYLAARVLAAFDRDRDGVIRRDEFLDGVRRLVFGTVREKLAFAFEVHDEDGDGAIGFVDLHRMIAISLAESEVAERASQPSRVLARVVFDEADRNRDGRITFDEFEAALSRRPHLLDRMTHSEAIWIAPNDDLLAHVDPSRGGLRARWRRTLENRWLSLLYAFATCSANLAIFVTVLVVGLAEGANGWMQIGRALGACIAFDGALVLLPVMRRTLTKLRSSRWSALVPVDDAVGFHRWLGQAVFVLVLLHAVAFGASYAKGHAKGQLVDLVFTYRGGTGLAALVVLGVLWGFAQDPVRRSRRFELFYFSHVLYVPFLVLLVVHAPSFLVVGLVPLGAFVVEQFLRLRRRALPTTIAAIEPLRSGVARLDIERPIGFTHAPGDYVFLRIPAIARHEWHPFTISSAPENDRLTVHVRSLGNWTAAVRRLGEARRASGDDAPLEIYVDGPYGSPSAHIFESTNAVFIGAGIGVTPFASVLESLVRRADGPHASKLRHVHFFWLNRDQYSFEWFAELLREIEKQDRHGMLEMHLCMTGGRAGVTAFALEAARDILHSSGRTDLVTGLRSHTHMGHPDWGQMLRYVASLHAPSIVDVYFCGPSGLAAKLKPLVLGLGMRWHEERF